MNTEKSPTHPLDANLLEMHPVAEAGLRSLRKAKGDYELDSPAIEQLSKHLMSYAGTPDLKPAVQALIALAHFLEVQLGSKNAAASVLEIAASAISLLKTQGLPRALDQIRERGKRFAHFGGRRATTWSQGTTNAAPATSKVYSTLVLSRRRA